MALSLREKRLIGAAALLLLLLLAFLLFGGGSEPAPAPPPAPPPALIAQTSPPAAAAPAPPPADISGLRLHGLLASGAILGFADGSQRLVPLGREALPGLTLTRIEQNHAVLAQAGSEFRLGFDGRTEAVAPAAGAAAPPTAIAAAEAAQREESLRYRVGLIPRRVDNYVRGFTVRPGADLPQLARAGIRPGDTILSVNGSILNEEQMASLAWTIANSSRVEFEVERGGRRLTMALEGH